MEFRAAIDNAENVIQSGSGAGGIDVRACGEAVNRVDAALGTVEAAGLQQDSASVTALQESRQRLQVCILKFCAMHFYIFLFFCVCKEHACGG